jgi:hypothetical protein
MPAESVCDQIGLFCNEIEKTNTVSPSPLQISDRPGQNTRYLYLFDLFNLFDRLGELIR